MLGSGKPLPESPPLCLPAHLVVRGPWDGGGEVKETVLLVLLFSRWLLKMRGAGHTQKNSWNRNPSTCGLRKGILLLDKLQPGKPAPYVVKSLKTNVASWHWSHGASCLSLQPSIKAFSNSSQVWRSSPRHFTPPAITSQIQGLSSSKVTGCLDTSGTSFFLFSFQVLCHDAVLLQRFPLFLD